GYNLPKYVVPYHDLRALTWLARDFLAAPTLQRRILRQVISIPGVARLWRWFFFSFLIFARKKYD
nr:hypothetical protein [Candidatus Magasanikbacteria bacterium]